MWPTPSLEPLVWLLAVALVLVGLAGIVLPVVPGVILVFAGLVVAAWADGFTEVGPATLVLLAGLTALAYLAETAAGAFGAARLGASRRAVWGAALGTLVGLFFGLPGILLGPFLGAVAGELTAHRQLARAGRAGAGAWLGLARGTAAKIALVFAMLAIFTLAYVF